MKVFDNANRGIAVKEAFSILVGKTLVVFDESLLRTAGATFANILVNAQLISDNADSHRLVGIANYEQDQNQALVKISVQTSDVGEPQIKVVQGDAKVAVEFTQKRQDSSGVEVMHLYNYKQVDALAVLSPGSAVSIIDTFHPVPRWNPFRVLGFSPRPDLGPITNETRFSYDGEKVTREHFSSRAV